MSDEWLVAGASINVDALDLYTFADLLEQDRDAFTWSRVAGPQEAFDQGVDFGSDLVEATEFGNAHLHARFSAELLLNDAVTGLTALAEAARMIATQYESSDAISAENIEAVFRSFQPAPLTTDGGADHD
jgi:hypothetical protein